MYAEEFVRLLTDRGVSEGSAAVPESLQALIAARLDTLTPDRKSLLQDAAVIGKVFWAGALAEMGDRDPREVEHALHELARKELVRASSQQLDARRRRVRLLARPRAETSATSRSRGLDRATRHRLRGIVAGAQGGRPRRGPGRHPRPPLTPGTRAHARRGAGDAARELEAPALRFLVLAGERALNLDTASADASLRRALELAPEGHPERARILTLRAHGAEMSGDVSEAVPLYEEAIAAYLAAGDEASADEATLGLSVALSNSGEMNESESLIDAMLGRLEGQGPSELLARAYCSKQYHHQNDLTWAEKALAITEQLDLASVRARALNMRGLARACSFGDPRGIDDLRASLALALEQHGTREANVAYVNLTGALALADPAAALEVADEGMAFATARGLSPVVRAVRQMALLRLGRWDELLEVGRELIGFAEPLGDRWIVDTAAAPMALVLTRRGAIEEALELAGTPSNDPRMENFGVVRIVAHRIRGELAEAEKQLEDSVQVWVT